MDINNLRMHIPQHVLEQLPEVLQRFKINTPKRLAHFLAQCAHESGSFKYVEENLNYSAKRLMQVFPKYFPTLMHTKGFHMNPEAIANKVYASRIGNGTQKSGDGYKYRGRGYIQLTGKANYIAFAQATGYDVVTFPDLVATTYPLLSAAWFWWRNGLNELADTQGINAVTKRVNGGYNGLKDREAHYNKYIQLLNL